MLTGLLQKGGCSDVGPDGIAAKGRGVFFPPGFIRVGRGSTSAAESGGKSGVHSPGCIIRHAWYQKSAGNKAVNAHETVAADPSAAGISELSLELNAGLVRVPVPA